MIAEAASWEATVTGLAPGGATTGCCSGGVVDGPAEA